MAEIDAALLAASGRSRPRVAILPTASWPDGEEVFRRWADMGAAHFTALGAEVEPVLVRDRFDADDDAPAQAIGEADLVYLSGGKPGHLTESLLGTRVGDAIVAAHERGAALAGCSAGAMILAGRHFDFRIRRMPFPLRWQDSLALVPKATVIPHYDAWPEALSAAFVLQSPRGPRDARHRRGHRGRRAGRVLAGPGGRPGDGLAGPPSRTVPPRRRLPDLRPSRPGRPNAPAWGTGALDRLWLRERGPGPPRSTAKGAVEPAGQSGFTWRKQSEQ